MIAHCQAYAILNDAVSELEDQIASFNGTAAHRCIVIDARHEVTRTIEYLDQYGVSAEYDHLVNCGYARIVQARRLTR